MNFVGALFLISVDVSVLKRALGLVFLAFSLYRYSQLLRAARQSPALSSKLDASLPAATLPEATSSSTALHGEVKASEAMLELAPLDATSEKGAFTTSATAEGEISPEGRTYSCSCSFFRSALLRFIHGGWRSCVPQSRSILIGGLIAGIFAGFLNGSFGTGGPPLMIFFTYIPDLEKDQIRATTSFQNLLLVPVRIASCFAYDIYTSSDWPLYLASPFISVSGLYFGSLLQKRVNRDQVAQALMLLVFLAALNLSGVTQADVYSYVILAVFIVSFASVVGAFVWHSLHPPARWELAEVVNPVAA